MATLGDIMSKKVFTTLETASLAEVAGAMVKGRFGSAVVTDGQNIVGIITERDVLRAAAAGADATSARVGTWMTPDPETATEDVDSEDATVTMISAGYRHLPIVDAAENLIGIVSLRDVLSTRIAAR